MGCFGAERFLINCSYTTPLFDSHFEDAGVRCAARESRPYIHVCTCIIYDGDVCMYIVIHCSSVDLSSLIILFVFSYNHTPTYSHTHSFVHSLTHTHSFTHSLTHTLIHTAPANCTNGEIRLVNGPSPNQGRVES